MNIQFQRAEERRNSTNPTLVFREARSKRELWELFRLRQRIIRGTRHRGVLPDTHRSVAIDGWDLYAHHFGLFQAGEHGDVPVGYQRGVSTQPGPAAAWVREIATQTSDQYEIEPSPAAFPFLTAFDGEARRDLEDFERRCRGRRLGESGCFVIDPSVRSPRVGRFLVESVIAAYLLHLKYEIGITVVSVRHGAFYRRAGFVDVLGYAALSKKGAQEGLALTIVEQSISKRVSKRVDDYAAQLEQTAEVRFSFDTHQAVKKAA